MKVTTNNVPRFTVEAHELTAREREQHDYLDWSAIDRGEDSATFVRYKRHTYYLDDFARLCGGGPLADAGWQGAAADSYFSGTVIRFIDDESVVVGWYCQ
jgi:hypothetical protein